MYSVYVSGRKKKGEQKGMHVRFQLRERFHILGTTMKAFITALAPHHSHDFKITNSLFNPHDNLVVIIICKKSTKGSFCWSAVHATFI